MSRHKQTSESATLVGRRAPDFQLPCTRTPDHPDRTTRLDDYRDRWLILVFYPQDFSLVCPTELSALSDRYDEFVEHGADILAVSTDPLDAHDRWIATGAARGGLGPVRFPLASDVSGEVCRAYHVFAEAQRVALRGLFLIDPNGVTQYQVVHALTTGRRTDEVLRVLTALQTGGLCADNWTKGQRVIDPAVRLKPGNVISHYRIEETLGAGGFATVFRAYDASLERQVALKILKRVDDHAPSIRDEAKAAAALNHPNVCTVFAIDDGAGFPIIVMELLTGSTLKDIIASGPTARSPAADIARQVAAAMAAAHRADLVHGDLKPANIMLTDGGIVKVLDFGLAGRRRIPQAGESTVSLAMHTPGGIVGTPSYMSPEQADGAAAGPESDVFSFGVILYELLTGKAAFGGETVSEVLARIRGIEPEVFARAVASPFDALLQVMLQRERQLRTITMAEIEARLSAASGGT